MTDDTAQQVLPTLPGVLGEVAPELITDRGREVLPLLGPRCERRTGVYASFSRMGSVSTATQPTPFVVYTRKLHHHYIPHTPFDSRHDPWYPLPGTELALAFMRMKLHVIVSAQ